MSSYNVAYTELNKARFFILMPKSQTPANDATNCSPYHSPRSDTVDEYTQKKIFSERLFSKRLRKTGLPVTCAQIGKGVGAVPSALEAIDIYTLLAHVGFGEIAIQLRSFWCQVHSSTGGTLSTHERIP